MEQIITPININSIIKPGRDHLSLLKGETKCDSFSSYQHKGRINLLQLMSVMRPL